MQESTKNIVNQLAAKYNVNPATIAGLIQEESGWNPTIKNPLSSARGLIQFIDSTAQGLGYDDSLDLVTQFPDVDSQLLGPVQAYFDLYAPYPSEESFILAVFLPAWRNKALTTVLPDSIKNVNPGIDTLGDYVNRVRNSMSKFQIFKDFIESEGGGISLGLIAILAIGSYMFLRK
jgi:hypothetical protein